MDKTKRTNLFPSLKPKKENDLNKSKSSELLPVDKRMRKPAFNFGKKRTTSERQDDEIPPPDRNENTLSFRPEKLESRSNSS